MQPEPKRQGPVSSSTTHGRQAIADSDQRAKPWWRQPVIAIPIAISLLSASFTGGTYWNQIQANSEQSQVDASAALANQMADARLVSYQLVNQPGEPSIVVQNLGQQPLYAVTVDLDVTASPFRDVSPGLRPDASDPALFLGNISPCSENEIQVTRNIQVYVQGSSSNSQTLLSLTGKNGFWLVDPVSIEFTDANHRTWRLTANGFLSLAPPVSQNMFDYSLGAPKVTAAAGC